MLKNSIKLIEPQWWENFLKYLNNMVNTNELLKHYVPITADIFVFVYPVFLFFMYIYWIYKKNIEHKIWALYVFFAAWISVVINLWIQYLVDKQRPEQIALSKENLIFDHVPTKPFPSDHAAVSSAIAMATLLWGIKTKNKFYIFWWICLWIFSIIMCFSRIGAWVHWPTDIFVGTLIWMSVSIVLLQDYIFVFLKAKILYPLVKIEKKIFSFIGIKQ